jgi:carboxyl-terminal processing protease
MSNRARVGLVSLAVGLGFGLFFNLGYFVGGGGGWSADPELASVEQAWSVIVNDYVGKDDIDHLALSQGAIEGMLDVIDDPYTGYFDPQEYELDISESAGKYIGIGATIIQQDNQFLIVAVATGSPAELGGVKVRDTIQAVGGVSTEDMDLNDLGRLVRGEAGTSLTLLVLHLGETSPVEITVTRAEIEVDSVTLEMRDDIAYIAISQFTGRTDDELGEVLAQVKQQGAAGIVLDLRGNPGGYLDVVVMVVSRFVEEGQVLSVRDSYGNVDVYPVVSQDVTTDLPMVVLVDSHSASGSEVVAAALKDHGRALIAGQTTYGKGSANVMYPLADGAGLYITIARWLTPNGDTIEGTGVVPDVELTQTGDDAVQWAINYLHDNAP